MLFRCACAKDKEDDFGRSHPNINRKLNDNRLTFDNVHLDGKSAIATDRLLPTSYKTIISQTTRKTMDMAKTNK